MHAHYSSLGLKSSTGHYIVFSFDLISYLHQYFANYLNGLHISLDYTYTY